MRKSKNSQLNHDVDEHANNGKIHRLLVEVMAHEPQNRPKALLELLLHPDKDESELWPIVGQIWCEAKNGEVGLSEWSKIWSMDGNRHLAMKKRELEHLTDMPEKFTVWQGGAFLEAAHGLSWTGMETAYRNALRVATVEKPGIAVWGQLEKSKVLAFFSRRGRSEFVTFPADVKSLGYKPVRVRSIDDYSRWETPSSDD